MTHRKSQSEQQQKCNLIVNIYSPTLLSRAGFALTFGHRRGPWIGSQRRTLGRQRGVWGPTPARPWPRRCPHPWADTVHPDSAEWPAGKAQGELSDKCVCAALTSPLFLSIKGFILIVQCPGRLGYQHKLLGSNIIVMLFCPARELMLLCTNLQYIRCH